MRTTCSRAETNTLPSPIFPVRAEFSIASITRSTMASSTAASILTLGRKSTTYSAPRYSSVWPFWRPKPLTSVTVMPCTPMAESASRTSSSLKGLMMAVTSFMMFSYRWMEAARPVGAASGGRLERLGQHEDEPRLVRREGGLAVGDAVDLDTGVGHQVEGALLGGALYRATQRQAAAEVIGGA